MLGKPYTGSGAEASGIAMDKIITKKLAESAGIRIAKNYDKVSDIDSYPVVIKPALEGSSVGIFFCHNKEEAEKSSSRACWKKSCHRRDDNWRRTYSRSHQWRRYWSA